MSSEPFQQLIQQALPSKTVGDFFVFLKPTGAECVFFPDSYEWPVNGGPRRCLEESGLVTYNKFLVWLAAQTQILREITSMDNTPLITSGRPLRKCRGWNNHGLGALGHTQRWDKNLHSVSFSHHLLIEEDISSFGRCSLCSLWIPLILP